MTAFQSRNSAERLRRLHARRKGLLLSCAFGTAVALAAQPDAALAQAIQAIPDFNPNVTRTPTSGNSETISVSNPSTVINWSPTSTPTGDYEFLPAGNTVTFQHSGGDFAVLNRINIPQRVRFDGTVISQIVDPLSGVGTRGGTILFSAPSGIIIGSSAIFDVGSLVLTTLDVSNLGGDDGYGNFDFVNADGSRPRSGSKRTAVSGTSTAMTARLRGTSGWTASSRSDAWAALVSAAYSSSSMSSETYHSRRLGVTA